MPTKKTKRSTSRAPLAKSRANSASKARPAAAKPAPARKPTPRKRDAGARSAARPAQPAPSARPAAPSAARAATPARAPAATSPSPGASEASTYLLVISANERRGRRFMRLKAPSVFDWFQRAIRLAREGRRMIAELGGEVHGLDEFFDAVQSRKLAIPSNAQELTTLLGKHLKAERDLETEPHFIHAETDDDEIEIEYFLFDDTFLASSEALDRLPSPKRRAQAVESDDDEEVEELEEFEVEDDDDPYTVLIERIADA